MGRMHNPGKGISKSALPYRRSVPSWLKLTNEEVQEHIVRLAKKVCLGQGVNWSESIHYRVTDLFVLLGEKGGKRVHPQ